MSLLKRKIVLTWRGYALLGLLVGGLLAAVALWRPQGPARAVKGLLVGLGLQDPARPPKGSSGHGAGKPSPPARPAATDPTGPGPGNSPIASASASAGNGPGTDADAGMRPDPDTRQSPDASTGSGGANSGPRPQPPAMAPANPPDPAPPPTAPTPTAPPPTAAPPSLTATPPTAPPAGPPTAGARPGPNGAGNGAGNTAGIGAGNTAGPRPALTVVLVQPQALDLRIALPATGNIAAWQEASIGAQAVGGQLAEVHAQVGDLVRRGQTLAVFATDVARADMAQLSAAEAEAESALAEASSNAQRARDVQASGALSAQQISQYLAAERAAQARLAAQRAALRAQALRLAQSTVVAPDDGVISQRNATAGAVVPVGQELFRLIRHGRLEWRAEVPSTDLGRIQPGQTARLVLPDGRSTEGRVRLIGPTVDASTRNGLVYVDLPKGSAALPGMFARGEFELGGQRALTVPHGAVQLRDGFSHVYTVGPDNRVIALKVGVGRRDGDRVEITSGLTADSRIVASGAGFLNDGDLVRVSPAPSLAVAQQQAAQPSR